MIEIYERPPCFNNLDYLRESSFFKLFFILRLTTAIPEVLELLVVSLLIIANINSMLERHPECAVSAYWLVRIEGICKVDNLPTPCMETIEFFFYA